MKHQKTSVGYAAHSNVTVAMFLVSQPNTVGMMPTAMISNPDAMKGAVQSQSSVGDCINMYSKLQETLEPSMSPEGKAKIARIKGEVQSLTHIEKFLLYSSLPTGLVTEDPSRLSPPSCLPSSNRKEQAEAFTWIKSHLEEHGDVCLPKSQVYDEYRNFCQQHELRFLCNADFGKMMKQVFPDINTRRLGQRGQSRYFYGGLRKKNDHTPPSLPELEIQSKTMEIDSNTIGNEVFKASCLLVCEWADKLLDMKFTGIQDVARHLVANMLVNTKSVPAFTVLADMQENGYDTFKGSALFNSQCAASGDKHKETNMLLQQKLHKNKLIQEQKEKIQAMKDEATKHDVSTPLERVTPSTPSRKSTTPSRMSKTPKQCSTKPSPLPVQSPLKLVQSPSPVQPTKKSQLKQSSDVCPGGAVSLASIPASTCVSSGTLPSSNTITSSFAMATSSVSMVSTTVSVSTSASSLFKSLTNACMGHPVMSDNGFTFDATQLSQVANLSVSQKSVRMAGDNFAAGGSTGSKEAEIASNLKKILMAGKKALETGRAVEVMIVNDDVVMEEVKSRQMNEAETPYTEMDTESEDSRKHVRKIDFDCFAPQQTPSNVLSQMTSAVLIGEECKKADIGSMGSSSSSGFTSTSSSSCRSNTGNDHKGGKLSKSAEEAGLKTLLENKSHDDGSLNKSKNKLFVNQSTVPGRSAFVPFSQSRKENVATTKSSTITILQPASTNDITNQSSSQKTSAQIKPLSSRPVDSILKLIPSSMSLSHKDPILLAPVSISTGDVPTSILTNMSHLTTKDALTIVTTSSSVAKPMSTDPVLSSIQHSPGVTKQYIPIQPKPMNCKGTPVKEPKGESHANDKRPVSQLLKEKRAREQAEALLKIQGNAPLGAIQSVAGMSVSSSAQLQLGGGIIPSKELLLLLNKQAQSAAVVMDTQGKIVQPAQSAAFAAKTPISAKSDSSKNVSTLAQVLRDPADTMAENVAGKAANVHHSFTVVQQEVLGSCTVNDCIVDEQMETEKGSLVAGSSSSEMSTSDDRFDEIYTETPAKVAKLNITNPSPFRPESACSIGRETPSRGSRLSDISLSRPDSACSLGRETPSGARKRKSSDFHPRRDFKRLNSTGDEGDEVFQTSRQAAGVLSISPGAEVLSEENPRRAQSCTSGIDKVLANKSPQTQKVFISRDALQSPDISSLEMEALIESYPLYDVRPNKAHKHQSMSVGVNAKSLQSSHQKLLKQKQQLDRRVSSYFLKEGNMSVESSKLHPQIRCHSSIGNMVYTVKSDQSAMDTVSTETLAVTGQLVKDGIASAFRKEFDNTCKQTALQDSNDLEPSGLPNDVADFIIEKSEEKNPVSNSLDMAEPFDKNEDEAKRGTSMPNLNFVFEMKGQNAQQTTPLQLQIFHASTATSMTTHSLHSPSMSAPVSESTNHPFTVPKVPALASRSQVAARPESLASNTRCQSLPTFNSPVQSPMSPVASPVSRGATAQRASSMSPRTGHADIISPVGGMISPLRRMEVRENHPITLNIHPANKQAINFGGKPVYDERGKASYLASIQHTLQKPNVNNHQQKSYRDQAYDKIIITQNQTILPVSRDAASQERNTSSTPDLYLSNSRISDSGYHSTGPSPILNSTPVSSTELEQVYDRSNLSYRQTVTESPITMTTELAGKGLTIIPHQQTVVGHLAGQIPQTSQYILTLQSDNGMQAGSLSSSTNSAFTPISSNKEHRYVAPIKPIVTLPETQYLGGSQAVVANVEYTGSGMTEKGVPLSAQKHEDLGFPGKLFLDLTSVDNMDEAMMVSPQKSYDPPSYETAVKSLRRIDNSQGTIITSVAASDPGYSGSISSQLQQGSRNISGQSVPCDQLSGTDEQPSFLVTEVGNSEHPQNKAIGPFASKLVELSRQTIQEKSPPELQQKSTPQFQGNNREEYGKMYAHIERATNSQLQNAQQLSSLSRDLTDVQLSVNSTAFLQGQLDGSQINAVNRSPNNVTDFFAAHGASAAINSVTSTIPSSSSSSLPQNKFHLFNSQNSPSFNLLSLSTHERQCSSAATVVPSCQGDPVNGSMQFQMSCTSTNSTILPTSVTNMFNGDINIDIDSVGVMSPTDDDIDLTDVNSVGLPEDMNLALESLKDMDGQYPLDVNNLYATDQLLGDFDLFSQ